MSEFGYVFLNFNFRFGGVLSFMTCDSALINGKNCKFETF